MSGDEDEAWAAVRQAYEHSDMTLQDICSTFNVTLGKITYRRKRGGWQARRRGRRPQKTRQAPGNSCERATDKTHSPIVVPEQPHGKGAARTRAANTEIETEEQYDADQFAGAVGRLMDRLFGITEKEISIIEERMEMGKIRSPADSARDTSSIGSLIKNLEKLTEFNEQIRGGADKRGSVAGLTADEADLIRRDLAQRIERLNKG